MLLWLWKTWMPALWEFQEAASAGFIVPFHDRSVPKSFASSSPEYRPRKFACISLGLWGLQLLTAKQMRGAGGTDLHWPGILVSGRSQLSDVQGHSMGSR